ncbi:hypothetical protein OQJ26_17355 [Legionella sp. PATHC038]|uniref:hypothetical protein n=1 Tax=Legionella sheltonii TaxID=2992041 RepID=UPI002242F870|nr:hypothetical protein [Legionella sp. PATHC038]MCW8400549.1 hypothetical protein [Legionella sp. PATHC038]
MPTLEELTNKSKKKFKKSDYRPWNYMDELDKEHGSQSEFNKVSIDNQLEIQSESNGNQLEIDKESNNSEPLEIKDIHKITKPKKTIESPINFTPNNLETVLDTIFRLTGHQKKIFLFITERCISRAMLSTGVIKGDMLMQITSTTMKMVKTSIQRLVSKQLIVREKGKTGRGGFYSFKLSEIVRNAALEYKKMVGIDKQLDVNWESIGDHLEIERKGDNKKVDKTLLSEEWKKINIYPLEDIGFNHNHLSDIFETKLADPQMVQESILHFAYGLEYESVKYKQYDDLLNLLIGRLRKGKPWFEKNYRSPQEIAQAQLLEAKKNELERKKKAEEDAFKLALTEWQEGLSQSEITNITAKKGAGDIIPHATKLSIYFRENIWPEQKKTYLIVEE